MWFQHIGLFGIMWWCISQLLSHRSPTADHVHSMIWTTWPKPVLFHRDLFVMEEILWSTCYCDCDTVHVSMRGTNLLIFLFCVTFALCCTYHSIASGRKRLMNLFGDRWMGGSHVMKNMLFVMLVICALPWFFSNVSSTCTHHQPCQVCCCSCLQRICCNRMYGWIPVCASYKLPVNITLQSFHSSVRGNTLCSQRRCVCADISHSPTPRQFSAVASGKKRKQLKPHTHWSYKLSIHYSHEQPFLQLFLFFC